MLVEQCFGPCYLCDHTSWLLGLEIQKASGSPQTKYKFSSRWSRVTYDNINQGAPSRWAILKLQWGLSAWPHGNGQTALLISLYASGGQLLQFINGIPSKKQLTQYFTAVWTIKMKFDSWDIKPCFKPSCDKQWAFSSDHARQQKIMITVYIVLLTCPLSSWIYNIKLL